MSYVTLAEAKSHLNIEAEYDGEDTYITSLIETAEDVVASRGRIDLSEMAEENGGTIPPRVRHAILLLVAEFYLHREASADKKLYYEAVDRLINLFTEYER